MVAQHLQHTAIGRVPAAAFMHHPLQFCPKGLKSGHTLLNLLKLPASDGIGLRARLVRMIAQIEKLTDRVQREPELPRMPDERQTVKLSISIAPLTASRSPGLGQESDLLVIADRLHLRPGLFCQSADCQHITSSDYLQPV
jgi:hypothetical protein